LKNGAHLMDRKIRIYFFPRDASRVRAIVFSRRAGTLALVAALPLCLLGFWLVFTGELRESPERRFERDKLERETSALNEKTTLLQDEIEALRRNLDSLESIRIRVALSSGLEAQRLEETADPATSGSGARYGGSPGSGTHDGDFSGPLEKVRGISRFMDSTLIVLAREASRTARLPTAAPVAPGAIVTRDFGPARDPFTGRKALHPGVDFGLPPGSPVHAAGGGTVVGAGLDPVWGHYVRVRHTERAETFYAHLLRPGVSAGQEVARGQIIGWVGQSGAATGPHLHFEMRLWGERIDPMPYLLHASGGI
jgi:murein DD-endopeptidase MepM/ murein hydrolase activator NlpD